MYLCLFSPLSPFSPLLPLLLFALFASTYLEQLQAFPDDGAVHGTVEVLVDSERTGHVPYPPPLPHYRLGLGGVPLEQRRAKTLDGVVALGGMGAGGGGARRRRIVGLDAGCVALRGRDGASERVNEGR